MVNLIEQVEAHPYHGAKFLAMRKQWAQRGKMEGGYEAADGHEHLGFQVHLD
jgi:hypothetical protein